EPIVLDELTIYDVALSASDLQAINDAGSAGKCRCVTGGQFVDLTVVASGGVSGAGSGVGAIVSGPLALNYEVRGCAGGEMFLLVRAPALGLDGFAYYSAALAAFVPLPGTFSLVTPSVAGGPSTADGTGTLFTGTLPPGTYDFYLACDLV